MRLQSIKLSGFKSFVEPVTLQLPGQLVGIVGPNGCGKSNVIDAVRWVLGESKASELRGESMQDVIFNGSGERKPAGRASVELVFDNADGRAGGAWSRYAEIAVKRVLTRDGTSSYLLNNQTVRRRDVQDVFLGTGLGPRAYAIIGQGTISRIIESKPEELRLFLEEAAGVSKYKERRRETESRLKDTRENLTRVEDILRELTASLEKLESQAEVAQRYRALQSEQTTKQQQLWLLKEREAEADAAKVAAAMVEAQTALDARTADLRAAEAGLERTRSAHHQANDALHASQGALGEASLVVSRLEERIRHVVAGRERIGRQRGELASDLATWRGREDDARAQQGAIGDRVGDAERAVAAADEALAEGTAALDAAGFALRQAQGASTAQRATVGDVQRRIGRSAVEMRAIDERIGASRARLERLGAEEQGLVVVEPVKLEAGRAGVESARAARDAAEHEVHRLQDELQSFEDLRREARSLAETESHRQAELAARLDALRALQEKVQVEDKLVPWLERHGLDGLPGLWTRLRIEPGWEPALEAVLRERMSGREVGRLEAVRAFVGGPGAAGDAPPARLAFFTPTAAPTPGSMNDLPRLFDLLRLGDASLTAILGDWLAGVYTAPNLDAALAAREQLEHGEVIMTREGHAVGSFSVAFYAPDSEAAGLLARAQEIENLERAVRAQQLLAEQARAEVAATEAGHADTAARLAAGRRQAGEAQGAAHAAEVELLRLTQAAEQATARLAQLGDERGALLEDARGLEARRAEEDDRFQALDAELAGTQQRQAELDDAVHAADRAIETARSAQRARERAAQEASFERRSLAARVVELERAIATAGEQIASKARADERLADELAGLADDSASAELDAALAVKLEREGALGRQRSVYDELAAALRAADESRMGHEQALQPLRDRLGALQLEAQAARLGGAQYAERLDAANADRAAIGASIEEGGVRLHGLAGRIDALGREIDSLGAVNLAALDELGQARERKTFLDAQNADLTDAMQTLEGAIRTIDLETRELLQTTFDTVNGHFGRMFPVLFGGGNARLAMTGDEILDAGVQVMAQPPGKKNASIHLLSGGEKALTAIALVFAIFQLNPAPFCLLDEVDAPLDDANTERYAKLVHEMSAATQFVFISHNRIAMEMASQLIGVTMQEQGVSRIVSVDMPQAMKLAEAA